jgi:hypothetical protein
MIPYEELVAALARWRARQGLPTGLGDYLGESAPPADDAYAARDHSRDDVVELGDEHIEDMIESQVAHGGNGGNGAALVDEHDLPDMQGGPDLVDYGAPGSDETTKPAGLAGLIDAGATAGADHDHGSDDGRDAPAEPKPVARGRSRGGGRRRRK